MTSVAQLPVELAPSKTPTKVETPRTRAGQPREGGNEGGFAAALANAMPERQQPAKAEQSGHKSLEVEGEGVVAEEAEGAASPDATEALPPATAETAVKAAALTLKAEATPVESLPGAVRPAEGTELAAGTAAADAPAGESLAEPEVAGAVRQLPTAESMQPGIPPTEGPAGKTAPLQAEQAMNGSSTQPQRKEGLPAVQNEGSAAGRSNAQSPVAAKTELPREDDPPVLEFQVRPERPARDVGRTRLAAPSDLAPPLAESVAAAPQGGLEDNEAQAERGRSGYATSKRDEAASAPGPQIASGKSFVIGDTADSQAQSQTSEPVALKPSAAQPPSAQSVNGLQVSAAANTTPAELRAVPPAEEARPIASANPPSEPEIAAKLQQQSGRTTLSVVLQDERLGRVALQLVERGGWIETVIRASDPRTAQTLSNGAAGLFEALQQRGLALAGGGAAAWDAQEGQRRENSQRDTDSQRRRFRMRRASGDFEGALARVEV